MTLPTSIYDLCGALVTGSPGTGSFTLGGAITGFKAFSTIPNGTQIAYCATDGTNTEESLGTVSASGTSMTRGEGTIFSTNANALVNFGGNVQVQAVFGGPWMQELINDVLTMDGGTF